MTGCGQCNNQFRTDDEYLAHVCPTTGFTPADPKHYLTPELEAVQKSALERGEARKGEELHPSQKATLEIEEEEPIIVKPTQESNLISAVAAAKKKNKK